MLPAVAYIYRGANPLSHNRVLYSPAFRHLGAWQLFNAYVRLGYKWPVNGGYHTGMTLSEHLLDDHIPRHKGICFSTIIVYSEELTNLHA